MTSQSRPKSSLLTEELEQFARDHGYIPGRDCMYHQADLWISRSGNVHIYPFTGGNGTVWVAAIFYRSTDNTPFKSHTYNSFARAILRHQS